MSKILYFACSDSNIGYRARTSTQGEELEMVHQFIKRVEFKYRRYKKKNLAIFIEPQLESGYPDIVLIEYKHINGIHFNTDRLKLSYPDLKIFFEILQYNSITLEHLQQVLGYEQNQIKKTIHLLSNCNLVKISPTGRCVRKRALKSFFEIKKIISIEAKINKWHDVIDQSYTNQWFSSETYVLLKKYSNVQCVKDCEEKGMGVIIADADKFKKLNDSSKRKLPVSYVSLLFNEWIIRKTVLGDQGE
jgi:predicted transcriptional regulator